MKRIVIIGTCGSGKTTLGKHLAEKLDYPVTDLDDLYWLPNWTRRPIKDFTSLIEKATISKTWIICGNQSRFRHLIWPKADTIIWLDLPIHILLWRTFYRALRNIRKKKPFCNGNYESFTRFLSHHSIIFWVLKSFLKHRRDYLGEIKKMPYVKWIHAKSVKDVKFLE